MNEQIPPLALNMVRAAATFALIFFNIKGKEQDQIITGIDESLIIVDKILRITDVVKETP